MPFDGPDIWEKHLYAEMPCPKDVIIPVSDPSAWTNNPGYRWAFNKMNLCTIQGLHNGPHGVEPKSYPVFSKPIYNLWGMGMDCQILTDKRMADQHYSPGHFWMEILDGQHSSVDMVLVNGKPKWVAKSLGIDCENQTFDHWKINVDLDVEIPQAIMKHFSSYTGHINFELIGNTVIEIHLRLSTEFVVFYGKRWLESIVSLYEKQDWSFSDSTTAGYSVPVFIDKKIKSVKIDDSLINNLKNNEKILDIQVCIDSDGQINGSANPSGGNRIAVINSIDLDEALKIREILKESILL